jgi:hypothetical protein
VQQAEEGAQSKFAAILARGGKWSAVQVSRLLGATASRQQSASS